MMLKSLRLMTVLVLLIVLVKSLLILSGQLNRISNWLTDKVNKFSNLRNKEKLL